MPDVTVDGITLHAEVTGSGDPLLLICGTGMDSTAWALHMEWLSELRTVITFDNRDSGRSSYVDADYTPRDMARDAASVLRELAGGHPADVLGYSLGGAVAQELAIAEPDAVRSLVLLSTWVGPDAWLHHRFRLCETIAGAVDRETMADFGALWLFTPTWFAQPANLEIYRSLAREAPYPQRPDGQVRQWRADAAHDARDRLPAVLAPSLVIAGAEDVLVPARYSSALASSMPNARYQEIDGAGHGLMLERPDVFQRHVTDFLQNVDF